MTFHVTTGQLAQILKISEPRLNDLIRRGKVPGAPPCVAGRRLWFQSHVAAAAEALGADAAEIVDATAKQFGYPKAGA